VARIQLRMTSAVIALRLIDTNQLLRCPARRSLTGGSITWVHSAVSVYHFARVLDTSIQSNLYMASISGSQTSSRGSTCTFGVTWVLQLSWSGALSRLYRTDVGSRLAQATGQILVRHHSTAIPPDTITVRGRIIFYRRSYGGAAVSSRWCR